MDPVAFSLGGLTIRWYGLLAATAFLTGYLLSRHWALLYGIDEDKFDRLVLILVPVIVIGARTAYVVATWDYFRNHPAEILRIDKGGLGSHGAIIGTLIVGFFAVRKMGIEFWNAADAFAPAFPLAHVFVRLGNFINGELYGLPTRLPWGIVFRGTTEPRHPSMLYEGLVSIGTLFLVLHWAKHRKTHGEVYLKMLFTISVVRLVVDYTRPRTEVFLGMMLTQVLAAGIALLCAAVLVCRKRQHAG